RPRCSAQRDPGPESGGRARFPKQPGALQGGPAGDLHLQPELLSHPVDRRREKILRTDRQAFREQDEGGHRRRREQSAVDLRIADCPQSSCFARRFLTRVKPLFTENSKLRTMQYIIQRRKAMFTPEKAVAYAAGKSNVVSLSFSLR